MQKINTFIFSSFIYCLSCALVFAQSAALLPNAQQAFFDANGNPLSGGSVTFYYPSTSNLKPIWQDGNEVTPYTNPVTLNAAGRPPGSSGIYGQGAYRQLVKDINGNIIWDAVTSSNATSGSVATTGDGDVVGMVKPWAGIVAPSQYQFAYGQQLNRTTFAALFTAITQSLSVICTSASNTLSGINDTTSINIGAPVEAASCVVPGTTVSSKTASTVVMSNPSSVSLNTTAIFFPFGNGDGSTTFTLPDFRGNVIAGRPNMGGTASSNLTTAFCANATAQGAVCGAQSQTLTQANLPNVVPTFTGAAQTPNLNTQVITTNVGQGARNDVSNFQAMNNTSNLPTTVSVTFTPGGTISSINGNVTQTAFSKVQPTITMNYIIKVTADTNSSVATGVTDIQGMIGSITCGTGITCSGNTITSSVISASAPNFPVVHPSSGNLACAQGHFLSWIDQNICSTADSWVLNSSDPSALFQATIGGTITNGDTVNLKFEFGAGACIAGVGCTVTANVVGADTTTTIAAKLVTAIKANATLFTASVGGYASGAQIAYVTNTANVLALDFNSLVSMKVTSTVTGAATETLTIANTSCGTVCSNPLDNNPLLSMARNSGAAPAPNSQLFNIQAVGTNSAFPTTVVTTYGILLAQVVNSTVGLISGRWGLITPDGSGTMNQGLYVGGGAYTVGVSDKGVDSVNAKTLWVNGTEEIASTATKFQLISSASHDIQLLPATGIAILNQTGGGVNFQIQGDVGQVQVLTWFDSAIRWQAYKPASSTDLRFYDGTADRLILKNGGAVLAVAPTGGLGYGTGAGGTVTQATNKSTTVVLNTVSGAITMNAAALAAATIVSFTFTNSAIAATDVINTNHISGGTTGAYTINCRATGAGTAACDIRNNTAGSLSEAIVIQFAVIKAVNN